MHIYVLDENSLIVNSRVKSIYVNLNFDHTYRIKVLNNIKIYKKLSLTFEMIIFT